jgi:hypothetical protein
MSSSAAGSTSSPAGAPGAGPAGAPPSPGGPPPAPHTGASVGEKVALAAELLTALSIVAAAGAFLYQSWWLADKTELSAYLAQGTTDTLSVYVANEGGTDVVITSIRASSDALENVEAPVKLPRGGLMVEHGKSTLLVSEPSRLHSMVSVSSGLLRSKPPDVTVGTTTCKVHLKYIDSKGKEYETALAFDCYAATVFDPDK